jgi:predicted nucleic acid-binding Zn ribbon protein
MSLRYFDFQCAKEHITEHLVDSEVTVVECPHCRNDATRLISTPRIKLEGITGAFPTAADQWARKHEEATRVAYKKLYG